MGGLSTEIQANHGSSQTTMEHHTVTGENVVMIGDTAHAIAPFTRNRACQAFEDASTMLTLFKEVTDISQIPKAFKAFDVIRRTRSQQLMELSRMFGRLYAFMEDGVGDDLNKIREGYVALKRS